MPYRQPELGLPPIPPGAPGCPSGPVPFTCSVVESPGAKSTPMRLAYVALICSGVKSGLLSASQDGRKRLLSIRFVTEMGRSKMV